MASSHSCHKLRARNVRYTVAMTLSTSAAMMKRLPRPSCHTERSTSSVIRETGTAYTNTCHTTMPQIHRMMNTNSASVQMPRIATSVIMSVV